MTILRAYNLPTTNRGLYVAYTVDGAFAEFYDEINLSGDFRALASARRDHIFNLLGNRFHLIDAFAGGSIPKYTALHGRADMDIFVVLHYGKHCAGRLPSQVLLDIRTALSGKERVRRNGQAVTLRYTAFPDVDVVPVYFTSHDGQRYEDAQYLNVPDMNTETWIRSMPKLHTARVEQAAAAYGKYFRRAIKMMKYWNWKHGDILRSFHIEALAVLFLGIGDCSSLPLALHRFFDAVHGSVLTAVHYDGARIDDYLTAQDRIGLSDRLRSACTHANSAWLNGFLGNHEFAIAEWRAIFGDPYPSYG
ncbi:hypothetical protein GD416_00180 [Burkholderia sp. BE24]|uniref:nucleotidyltransferase domain-containing protein n=1 Tax=Burkholderia TaxID=32008 RepID=UPI000B7A3C62|nr:MULTISPECIES: nucleotidyltransferase [Burkholderia]MPV54912.1 hypothetical protein [Burkholderia sp. BE24]